MSFAKRLKEKISEACTLVEGSEVLASGKKTVPWSKDVLDLSPTGRIAFIVMADSRPKTDSVRTPSGPPVAYYGRYAIDEAADVISLSIEGGSTSIWVV